MKFIISVIATVPPMRAVGCWWCCECETGCRSSGAVICLILALLACLFIYVVASIVWEDYVQYR